jgi:hypothetical protein
MLENVTNYDLYMYEILSYSLLTKLSRYVDADGKVILK